MATTTGIRYTIRQLVGTSSLKKTFESTPINDTLMRAMPLATKL